MFRSRHLRSSSQSVAIAQSPHTNPEHEDQVGVWETLGCRSGGAEFVGLGLSCRLVLSAARLH